MLNLRYFLYNIHQTLALPGELETCKRKSVSKCINISVLNTPMNSTI